MRVHIALIDDQHIVPRMMGWVAEALNWTMGANTDPKADLNYYAPYTMFWAFSPVETPTTGWFTHYETATLSKVELWEAAARALTVRATASSLYVEPLQAYGTTFKLTPGIDQTHFTPKGRQRKNGRVGIVGIGQHRKWGDIGQRLLGDGVNLVAAGTGWSIPADWVSYENMPEFYHGLEAYLCTALVEGIPAPPLEALACGVKVIVPSGVGIMDDLPEMEGVRHYEAGNYADMLRALNLCLEDKCQADTLRDVVKLYTKQAWVESHQKLADGILDGLFHADNAQPVNGGNGRWKEEL